MNKMKPKLAISLMPVLFIVLFIGLTVKGAGLSRSSNTQIPIASSRVPSSDDAKAIDRLLKLITNTSDCALPCFAGLEVAETTIRDIKSFIGKIDYNNVISTQIDNAERDYFSLFPDDNGLFTMGFSTKNDILQSMAIGITKPISWLPKSKNTFDLSDVVKELGTPENVYMAFSGPPLGFTMVLVYNEKGILIRYQATFTEESFDKNFPLPICFDPKRVDLFQIDVWIQDPNSLDLIEERQPGLHDIDQKVRPFWSLQKSVGINEEEFANFFTDNPDDCIKGLSTDNLQEAGYVF